MLMKGEDKSNGRRTGGLCPELPKRLQRNVITERREFL